MNNEQTDQEAFDKLLAWLDRDRKKAGDKYEKVRLRLIRIFACRGCSEPEQLADETIDRVMSKIDWLAENYVGDPVLYFCGVARNVLREDIRDRTKPRVVVSVESTPEGERDQEYDCLDQCMDDLPQSTRLLVLTYYEEEGQAKIARRKKLAEELGITLRALRLRVFHIRLQLKACMELCLRENAA
jgi:DNA-directed RNA polymerase specialized sigma24 family protein